MCMVEGKWPEELFTSFLEPRRGQILGQVAGTRRPRKGEAESLAQGLLGVLSPLGCWWWSGDKPAGYVLAWLALCLLM